VTSITKLDVVPTKRDWVPVLIPIMLALLSLVITGFISYNRTDKQVEHRVTVIETKQDYNDIRLERIENKVDKILDKVK
jgi:CHASE1-domain containing sensor protein